MLKLIIIEIIFLLYFYICFRLIFSNGYQIIKTYIELIDDHFLKKNDLKQAINLMNKESNERN